MIYCTLYKEPCSVKETNADEYNTPCHWCNSGKGESHKEEMTMGVQYHEQYISVDISVEAMYIGGIDILVKVFNHKLGKGVTQEVTIPTDVNAKEVLDSIVRKVKEEVKADSMKQSNSKTTWELVEMRDKLISDKKFINESFRSCLPEDVIEKRINKIDENISSIELELRGRE